MKMLKRKSLSRQETAESMVTSTEKMLEENKDKATDDIKLLELKIAYQKSLRTKKQLWKR